MIVKNLSDHANHLLEQSQKELLNCVRQKEFLEHELWNADDARRSARRSRSLLLRLLGRLSEAELQASEEFNDVRRRLDEVDHYRRQLQIQVDQRTAGARGEKRLEAALKWLSDDWVMFRGYQNRRGEADHVLVGPGGVWAVEVKSQNIRLHVDGDRWWHESVDRKGRTLRTGKATDRTGRSWARQVGDVAEALEHFLHKRGHAVPVRSAVLLMHDRAQLGSIRRADVDFVGTDPRRLMQSVADAATGLDRDELDAIVELVQQDHRFHEDRRRRRQKTKEPGNTVGARSIGY